ncbi:hypothetical protein TARUN_9218 [Trichoderma arundinaceum]|uniref:Ricin B lectin domain-containing protein n=1 Tax=Trichoderma arundinaceum TaxID=490622 RepID=A0A395NAC0_TRIAR|nr:hypothetical protein TARUN_9218 [Trichoderma arundinaceum]
MIPKATLALLFAALTAAGPIQRRAVASLDPAATAEAHPRDDTATRAFSNVQIKTSDGKCLSVDPLSGDFRANLTPIQITDCGSVQGQGWDVLTAGVHNDQPGQALIVSTLTQACFNFDPRRAAGNQVLLFSCGGRADGGGKVTNSQLFAFTGGAGPLSLKPENDPTKCFVAKGNVVDIADCNANDAAQSFTFGDAAGGSDAGNDSKTTSAAASSQPAATQAPPTSAAAVTSAAADATTSAAPAATSAAAPEDDQNSQCSAPRIVTVTDVHTVTAGAPPSNEATQTADNSEPAATTAAATSAGGVVVNPGVPNGGSQTTAAPSQPAITGNPTTPVPVSGAGGTLNPSAAAEANAFDKTAIRPLESVNIRASDGRCLFVNPTAGDFRENLIPVQLAECSEDPSQKFDIVTRGVHDDGNAGEALIVSVLTNGCLNFDGRRATGDTVIMFSCGGRADGSGKTATSQLFPFEGSSNNIVLTPASDNNKTCLVAGADRVESTQCNGQKDQTFELVEIL